VRQARRAHKDERSGCADGLIGTATLWSRNCTLGVACSAGGDGGGKPPDRSSGERRDGFAYVSAARSSFSSALFVDTRAGYQTEIPFIVT
jgi:hypothetical protein